MSQQDNRLYFEDLTEGQAFFSPGRTVTEADVVAFAGLSGDYNTLHTNVVAASESVFGERVAHGLLGLALQAGLGQRALSPGVRTLALLGVEDWRFENPIFLGDTISVHLEVAELRKTRKPGAGLVKWRRRLVNQKDEIVQTGITVNLVARRVPG